MYMYISCIQVMQDPLQGWTVRERNRTTTIQRILVQWLISKYGLSYKKVKHDILRQMMMGSWE